MGDARFPKIDGGGYLVTFIEYQMEFAAERLRWDRDELFGQLAGVVRPGRRAHRRWLGVGRHVQLLVHPARLQRANEIVTASAPRSTASGCSRKSANAS